MSKEQKPLHGKVLEDAERNFMEFQKEIASINPLDKNVPLEEKDPYTKLSKREMELADAPYITPVREQARPNIAKYGDAGKSHYNTNHDKLREESWKYIKVTVDNYESIGQTIEMWSATWGCEPGYLWHVPVNRPIRIPVFLAKQIKSCRYHEIVMRDPFESDPTAASRKVQSVELVQKMTIEKKKQRLDCNLYNDEFAI
jgi:hypothetical protein